MPNKSFVVNALVLSGIFASALAVRIWFNFVADHANCAGCCDASEYVRNATALQGLLKYPPEFWQKFFQCAVGAASTADVESVRAAMSNLKEVYQAGPVFPIFLTLSFASANFLFTNNPLGAPVLVQSILSAAACCLIADFTSKAWNRSAGYVAGVIAAIYPGFIINSGRLYTESFATFIVCLTLCLVVRGFFASKNAAPRAFCDWILVRMPATDTLHSRYLLPVDDTDFIRSAKTISLEISSGCARGRVCLRPIAVGDFPARSL